MSRTTRRNRKNGRPERDSYHRNTHFDRTCGHHGACPWCASGRTHATRRRIPA